MTNRKRLSLQDREVFENLLNENISIRKISSLLGVWPTSLYRELKRCEGKYNSKEAQKTVVGGFHPIDWKIIGKKFGLLTIESYIGITNHRTWWNALCDCGNKTKVSRKVLADYCSPDRPLSCGCIAKESKGQSGQVPFEESCLRKYQDLLAMTKKEGECLIFTGYIQGGKIPRTSWKNKAMSVRKCMYLIMNATTYEPNHVYAKCHNRLCVNPDHIVLGRPPNRYWYE